MLLIVLLIGFGSLFAVKSSKDKSLVKLQSICILISLFILLVLCGLDVVR